MFGPILSLYKLDQRGSFENLKLSSKVVLGISAILNSVFKYNSSIELKGNDNSLMKTQGYRVTEYDFKVYPILKKGLPPSGGS